MKYDNITPCIQCTKAGVSCTTTIPRKKRFYGPVKNISLHYKCLLALVTGLFPDSDVYNIEELIDLGHKLKFEMPSLNSLDEDMDKDEKESFEKLKRESEKLEVGGTSSQVVKEETKEESTVDSDKPVDKKDVVVNRGKNTTSEKSVIGNPEDKKQPSQQQPLQLTSAKAVVTQPVPKLPPGIKIRSNNIDSERLIMDKFGHTHFIGNFGTASLLNGLCDIIIKRSYNQQNPPTSTQDIRDSSVQTITSENVPVYQYPTHLYNLDTINVDRFPLINIVEREEADVYVKVFFIKVHPYYFIFNENHFKEKYEIFWEELNANTNKNGNNESTADGTHTISRLSSAEICTIYTVWILGRRFQQYSDPDKLPPNSVLDEEMIGKFIDIIKLSLSDIVLTPSIDGIRLLILFSVYLSSIKVRESGYCLMELAAIQAKSLGLHRKSIVNKFNEEKSDVMKRILWSLTKAETTLCCSFGRASAIPWEEIDIDFPDIEDEKDEHFKIFYLESCKLTKIIFEILDYKKKTQRDPLSLISIEKALYFKRKLETFWDKLPVSWKDYRSLPIKRYKPKLHIQYHYYFITLTLPMFLHLVNSHNYIVKNDDPFLCLLVCGIKSSFKTAEIISYTDSKGFFNGTIYYDVFYCYNAIMVLTLSYILFKSSQPSQNKQIIDLNNLHLKYDINLEEILKSINLIRKLVLNNLHQIDGTMKRMSDIIETLLEDLGIIHTLVKKYNAPKSNVRKIENPSESGNTSVTSIPAGYRRLKINLNKRKRGKSVKKNSAAIIDNGDLVGGADSGNVRKRMDVEIEEGKNKRAQSHPIESFDMGNMGNNNSVADLNRDMLMVPTESYMSETRSDSNSSNMESLVSSFAHVAADHRDPLISGIAGSSQNLFAQGVEHPTMHEDVNDVLSSLSLNTDLMDALFGADGLNSW